MKSDDKLAKRLLSVDKFHRAAPYKSHKTFKPPPVPSRADTAAHGNALIKQVTKLQQDYTSLSKSWEGREEIQARGLIIEIESAPNVEIEVSRFENEGLELLNERDSRNAGGQIITRQTWFVPDGKLGIIAGILNEYLNKTRKNKRGEVLPVYRSLVDSIERIGRAVTEQLWTEREEPFPLNQNLWFEIWLRAGTTAAERESILTQFRFLCQKVGLQVGQGRIDLPEHTIVVVNGNGSAFEADLAILNCIAEIRKGRDYADFFTGLTTPEQTHLAKELSERTKLAPADAPFVCILDTGINRGHPLLEGLIPEGNNLTIKEGWSAADDDDHGTGMASLCLYGNLSDVLKKEGPIEVPIHVEGMKIVPPPEARGADEKLAGYWNRRA